MESFSTKYKHSGVGLATTWDVMKYFWAGMRHHKLSLFITLASVLVARLFAVVIPIYYKKFFDTLGMQSSPDVLAPQLFNIIWVILGFNLIIWVGYRLGSFAVAHFQAVVIARLKQQAFDYMIDHSFSFYSNNFTGSLVQRVNRFARAFEVLTDRIVFDILTLATQIIGVCIVLWFVNPLITQVLIVWVLIYLAFNYIFARWKLKYDVKRAAKDSFTTGVLSDAISNQNTIALFAGSNSESRNFKDVTDDQARFTRFVWNLQGVVDTVQSLLIFIIEFLLFYFAIKYWQQGLMTIGTFVLIQVYLVSMSGHLWDFSRVIRNVYEAVADAKEMADILKLGHEVKDSSNAKHLVVPKGEVVFSDVEFGFGEDLPVLRTVNLTIKPGEKLAIIGPSGAGKSTFVKLLLRLYDISAGQILVDGQDIASVTQKVCGKT